jgi:hypothetical protein
LPVWIQGIATIPGIHIWANPLFSMEPPVSRQEILVMINNGHALFPSSAVFFIHTDDQPFEVFQL